MTVYHLRNVEYTRGAFTLRVDDCRIEPGAIYAVTGANGCGKTTWLHLLAFLTAPARGTLEYRGEAVNAGNGRRRVDLRREIGCLLQDPYLFNMSVRDNIAYGLHVRGLPAAQVRPRVHDVMERLSLLPLAGRNAHALSGGEAQRVALARTLVLEADVIILDEPTAGVDREHVRTVEEQILAANRDRGATVIMSTHSREQARRMADHQLSIVDGALRTEEWRTHA